MHTLSVVPVIKKRKTKSGDRSIMKAAAADKTEEDTAVDFTYFPFQEQRPTQVVWDF